ncbi:MAG: hypothetical protein A2Y63_05325 [Candidatus Riflebacteria bacterium RBG_13_59_9]|nr:MAG: hypothetical protein A2Y63_05325 [Candidatus Riflebacteria bacterium RBG_13_59_9]
MEKLIAGLETLARQEAGVAVDALRKALAQRELKSHRLLVVKPLTFMNLSGRAVAQVVNANQGVPFLVISDDVNLPWGELRLRERGGAGGHKGLASIVDELGGYRDFPRVRIGVGGGELAEVSDYVLTPLDEGERVQAEVFARAAAVKALEVAGVGYEFAASSIFLNQQED